MNRMGTRALAEGAIFAALTTLLGIAGFYMPFISFIFMFWAVPTIIVCFRNGTKVSFISAVVSSILMAFLTDPLSGLNLFITFGIPGIVMGYMLGKKYNPTTVILVTALLISLCFVAGIMLGIAVSGLDVGKTLNEAFAKYELATKEATRTAQTLYKSLGIPEEQLKKMIEQAEMLLDYIRMVIPFLLISSGVTFSFLNFKAAKLILKRIGYEIKDIQPFILWRLPPNFSLGLFVIAMLVIAGAYIGIPNMQLVIVNIISLLSFVFSILGLSVAAFFINRLKVNRGVKGILIFLVFLSFGQLLPYIGMFDVILNIRKLNAGSTGGV